MTKVSKKNQENTDLMLGHEFFAIQERFKGTPYQEIAGKIRIKYGIEISHRTIESWFYINGRLRDVYRDYADQMIKLEKEATDDFIRGNIRSAAKILAQVMMGKGGMPQVAAAQEFLNRGLGKVKDEVKHSGAVGHFSWKDYLEMKHGLERDTIDADAGDREEMAG